EERQALEMSREERGHLSGTRFVVNVESRSQPRRGLEDIRKILSQSGLGRETREKSVHIFEMIAREEAKIHNRSVDEIHFHEV
ncbi:nickel insertion protein, partial [Klebsiella variicola]|uniref:nickel insertion protein n=1 Tax=Klebsiella variicola TaxID=244366 RepID=UPI0027309C8A